MRINYVDILFLEWDKSIQKPYPYHYTWKCNSSELSGYIYLSIHLSIYLPIYLSIHPSIYLYLSISLSLSISPSIYLSAIMYTSSLVRAAPRHISRRTAPAGLLRQKPQRRGGFGLHQQDETDVLQQFQLRLRDLYEGRRVTAASLLGDFSRGVCKRAEWTMVTD